MDFTGFEKQKAKFKKDAAIVEEVLKDEKSEPADTLETTEAVEEEGGAKRTGPGSRALSVHRWKEASGGAQSNMQTLVVAANLDANASNAQDKLAARKLAAASIERVRQQAQDRQRQQDFRSSIPAEYRHMVDGKPPPKPALWSRLGLAHRATVG